MSERSGESAARVAGRWLEAARDLVQMTVAKDFYIDTNTKRSVRVRFVFGVSGAERQGTLYVNADLSSPWEPELAAHLTERWERTVHHGEHEPDANWPRSSFAKDASFVRGGTPSGRAPGRADRREEGRGFDREAERHRLPDAVRLSAPGADHRRRRT